jgi:hypothetical protein
VRGWIVKQLVNNKTGPRHYEERAKWTTKQTTLTLEKIKSEFPQKDIEKIVAGLVDEGIVEITQQEITIKNN